MIPKCFIHHIWHNEILPSAIMKLCFSTKPLLNGDSAAMTFTLMFMASHISKNSALENSPQLPVQNPMGGPKIWIQLLNIALMITLGSLNGMKVDADILICMFDKMEKDFPFIKLQIHCNIFFKGCCHWQT